MWIAERKESGLPETESGLKTDGGGKNEGREISDPRVGEKNSSLKPRLLLHSCCGPCSTAAIERLSQVYQITVYFYNPNITDREEYGRRRDAQLEFIEKYSQNPGIKDKISCVEGPWEPEVFLQRAKGLEREPEGGARCGICFELRLGKTAGIAASGGFDCFTTALTVSPHKDSGVISKIGRESAARFETCYLEEDFKKRNGYKRSVELSKVYGLYRQRYCGCDYSRPGFIDGRPERTAEI
jgi:predicted adenine nucleotide alpha hydrolase (AANH) superfamily ATPase